MYKQLDPISKSYP